MSDPETDWMEDAPPPRPPKQVPAAIKPKPVMPTLIITFFLYLKIFFIALAVFSGLPGSCGNISAVT